MRKCTTLLAALGLSVALAGMAGAQDRDHHGRGGHESGAHERGGREAPRPVFDGGGHDRRDPRGYEGQPDMGRPPSAPPPEFAPRRYSRPEYPGYAPGYGPPGYAPPYAAAPRGGNWRRGEVLPRPYWGDTALDPHRFRLRAPPPGYAWYGVGRDAYLVQRSTGLILDTAPGLW